MKCGFIDTHCHLSFKDLGGQQEETLLLLEESKKEGLDILINIATDLEIFQPSLDFSKKVDNNIKYPKVFSAIGIHPLHVIENNNFKLEDFDKFIKNPYLVAIGETGLDYYYSKDSIELQKKLFEIHCQVAVNYGFPIIIHSREAYRDTLDILSYYVKNHNLKGVIHCYSYNKEIAKMFLDIDFYLSFSGIVTFKNSKELQEAAIYTSKNRILSETDAPYLAPNPYRGKINLPHYVKYTTEFLAQLRQEDLEVLKFQIKSNTLELFNKNMSYNSTKQEN